MQKFQFQKIKSILYVEDEKNVQEELAEVLEHFCEKLYVADNGEEGLELFKKYHPEIVITDIKMPVMNGIQMAKIIRELNSEIQIIFTTAFSDAEYMQEAISLHADGYVIKPINLDLLEEKIEKSIKIYRLQNELNQKTKYQLRKKAELETILSTTKDGIAIVDLKSKFLYANVAFQNMIGYRLENLKKISCIELSIEEEREKFGKYFEQIITQGSVNNFEKKCNRADEKIITVSMSASLMPDENSILLATRDITKEVYTKNILNEYLNLIDENIMISTTDLKGYITYVSQAFCEITGYSKEELIGKSHTIVRHEDVSSEVYRQMWQMLQDNQRWDGKLKNKKKNGDYYWVYAKIYPIFDEYNTKIGYTSIRQNITDLKRVEELSIRDGLTGIYNRRYFNERLPIYINAAKRNNELISFAMLDIDFFKQYNDTYGHQKGDDVLIDVTSAINLLLNRSDDYFFRLGGEEFGVLFKTPTKEQSERFAKKILRSVEALKIPHKKSTVSEYVTISIGLVSMQAESIINGELLYKEVDNLLYEAKKNGRNRVVNNPSQI